MLLPILRHSTWWFESLSRLNVICPGDLYISCDVISNQCHKSLNGVERGCTNIKRGDRIKQYQWPLVSSVGFSSFSIPKKRILILSRCFRHLRMSCIHPPKTFETWRRLKGPWRGPNRSWTSTRCFIYGTFVPTCDPSDPECGQILVTSCNYTRNRAYH